MDKEEKNAQILQPEVPLAAVERLRSMQHNSVMHYVTSTALGVALGGAAGYGLSRVFGSSGAKASEMAVELAGLSGILSVCERMAEDRKVRQIHDELDAKYGLHTLR